MYKPPFTITNKMLNYSMSITEKLGKITTYESLKLDQFIHHFR